MSAEGSGGSRRAPHHVALWFLLAAVLFALGLVFSGQCALDRFTARAYVSRPLPPEPEPVLLPGPPPEDEDYFPCADCHEDEPARPTPRELEEHDDFDLSHGDLWCLDCHVADDPERLQLSDGTRVAFDESWKLCGRCHGEKIPDWRAGVHGKRTGYWRGSKEYRTCVACHRPHSPPTELLEPRPRPWRASEIGVRKQTDQEGADDRS